MRRLSSVDSPFVAARASDVNVDGDEGKDAGETVTDVAKSSASAVGTGPQGDLCSILQEIVRQSELPCRL